MGPAKPATTRRRDLFSVELGPAQFSGPVVGPADAYLTDCWTAILGPTQVLAYRRLHQVVGTTITGDDLARSLGFSSLRSQPRLDACLERLEQYLAISRSGQAIRVTPGLRYLTPDELKRAGPIVAGLHRAHLRSRQLEPERMALLAREGARAMRRPRTVVSLELGAS